MVKKTIKRPLRPGSDEVEEVEVENGDEAKSGEGEIPSQLVPYPTGNPWVPPPPPETPGTLQPVSEAEPAPEAAEEPYRKGKK